MGTDNGLNSRALYSNCGSELHETELFLRNWPLLSLSYIFPISYNPQAHFCVQKNTPLDHIYRHMNSVHISHPIHLRSIRLLSFHWHFRCNKQNIHMLYAFFWVNPRRLKFICRIYPNIALRLVHSTSTYLPMKMEQTECSETSAYKFQTPGIRPKESIQHSVHGESLKSKYTYFSSSSRVLQCPTYFTSFIPLPNSIWWRAQIMQVLTMQM